MLVCSHFSHAVSIGSSLHIPLCPENYRQHFWRKISFLLQSLGYFSNCQALRNYLCFLLRRPCDQLVPWLLLFWPRALPLAWSKLASKWSYRSRPWLTSRLPLVLEQQPSCCYLWSYPRHYAFFQLSLVWEQLVAFPWVSLLRPSLTWSISL